MTERNPHGCRARCASCLTILAVAAAGALPSPAALAAADIFDLPIESLMQVQVSVASPFRDSIRDSPSSVATLSPADWERRGARSLEDALEQVPSVVSYTSVGGAPMFAIRGYANDLSVRGTAMLLDGVPLNNFSYATAAYDLPFVPLPLLRRVEMLRGPGSALYGTDAFHGVIALDTWAPDDAHTALRAAAGSFGDSAIAANGGYTRNGLRGNGGVALTRHGDRDIGYAYTDPLAGTPGSGDRDHAEEDSSGYLNVGRGDIDEGRWRIGFYANDYRADGFPGIGTQFFAPLASSFRLQSLDLARSRDRMGQESSFVMGHGRYARTLDAGYRIDLFTFAWRGEQTWVLDGSDYVSSLTLLPSLGGATLPCRTSPPPAEPGAAPIFCAHTVFQGTADRRTGIHARLVQDARADSQWAIGAGRDWFEVSDAPIRRIGVNGTVYSSEQSPFDDRKRHVDHVLAQVRTDLSPFTLAYGLRWDEYSDFGGHASPRLALLYDSGDDWNAKLLYSNAFRAPSAGELYGTGALQQGNTALDPETIDSVELVFQQSGSDADTELVLFGSRWRDSIVLTPVAGTSSNRYVNSGTSRASGVELVHRRNLLGWRLEGHVGAVRSENRTMRLDYVAFPRWTANLGIGRPLGGGWDVRMNARGLFDMAGGDALGNTVPPRVRDYLRLDAHAGWRDGRLSGAIDLRNLLDRDNIMPAAFNATGGLQEEGISLQASLEYAF